MAEPPRRLLVSACLLGRACRHDGASKSSAAVARSCAAWQWRGGQVVPVCPEELGGLGTPRPAAELRGGDGAAVLQGHAEVRVVADNTDVTAAFLQGARVAADQAPDAVAAILKARSPSCGVGATHVDSEVAAGDGVFAALLRARGIPVQSDEDVSG